ncbi:putative baseplate protein [Dickeya phage vB_DsoM_JA33]|uniref:Putative baseplate protein n=3 Tax=Salmondvirus JA11 TaxID=2734141 RepID=A0A384ZW84_9CAUD|nr:putative baseplate protein [Dickeya phage vB_DsoM_JA11]AXG66505.1 putative baseplate protein [Dickeya phage vB_DsoM_JA13]AXG67475.1 putative baseplate protein [Dickeya phage vB_DsoM_JA33]AYD79906.1 putative baseplate protein [Dickeya phage vB_DsoM_JA11]
MGIITKRVNVPANEAVYSDINMDIKMELRDTVQDMDSITQKVLFVVGTRKGSRKWREKFGSLVYKDLFEPFDDETAGWIQTHIRDALQDPDNGLTNDITNVYVRVFRSEQQTYECYIAWRVPALEDKDSVTFALRPL